MRNIGHTISTWLARRILLYHRRQANVSRLALLRIKAWFLPSLVHLLALARKLLHLNLDDFCTMKRCLRVLLAQLFMFGR